jgi:hypothetical protein
VHVQPGTCSPRRLVGKVGRFKRPVIDVYEDEHVVECASRSFFLREPEGRARACPRACRGSTLPSSARMSTLVLRSSWTSSSMSPCQGWPWAAGGRRRSGHRAVRISANYQRFTRAGDRSLAVERDRCGEDTRSPTRDAGRGIEPSPGRRKARLLLGGQPDRCQRVGMLWRRCDTTSRELAARAT